MSRNKKIAALSAAVLAGCLIAGGAGAGSAQADSSDGHHYVASLRNDRVLGVQVAQGGDWRSFQRGATRVAALALVPEMLRFLWSAGWNTEHIEWRIIYTADPAMVGFWVLYRDIYGTPEA